jgi:hypothetical protein
VWQECRREAISLRLSVLCDGDRRVKQKIKLKSQIPNRLSRHLSVHEGWESKLSGDEARATMDNKLRGDEAIFHRLFTESLYRLIWYDTRLVPPSRNDSVDSILFRYTITVCIADLQTRTVLYDLYRESCDTKITGWNLKFCCKLVIYKKEWLMVITNNDKV